MERKRNKGREVERRIVTEGQKGIEIVGKRHMER
jgi:hypothetical protein